MRASPRPGIDLQAVFRLTELGDYIIPFTIRAICDLGVANHLADGPQTVEVLAAATHPCPSLHAPRALASKIFAETEPGHSR